MSKPRRGVPVLALALVAAGLVVASVAMQAGDDDGEADALTEPYIATVDEGLGTAVAILLDNSGSMEDRAPAERRSKHEVALEALEQMLLATEEALRERPDYPVKVGVYRFSSRVETVLPLQPYDREVVRAALHSMPGPRGGTAIGEAMEAAREDLYASGMLRKYVLVVTDGENTDGPSPERVGREINRRSEGAVQIYFVAFDTDPEKFGFLREIGGDVLAARGGAALRQSLSEVYRGKILAEAADYGEGAPAAGIESATTTADTGQR